MDVSSGEEDLFHLGKICEAVHSARVAVRPHRDLQMYATSGALLTTAGGVPSGVKGTVLLLIHGAGGCAAQFRAVWSELAAWPRYRSAGILALDMYGHGCTGVGAAAWEQFSPEEMTLDLVALLEHFRSAAPDLHVHILAHSYGTALTLRALARLAARDPEYAISRIHRVVLVGTQRDAPAGSGHPVLYLPQWALEWVRPMMGSYFRENAWHPTTRKERPELLEEESSRSSRNPFSVIKPLLRQMQWPAPEDLRCVASHYPNRLYIYHGALDRITRLEQARLLVDAISSSTSSVPLRVFEHSAHFPFLEEPNEFLRHLKQDMDAAEEGALSA